MSEKGRPSEIYALTHPRDGAIRYIGKAINSVTRLKAHLHLAKTGKTPVYRWLRKLLRTGQKPGLIVLEVSEDWQEAECRLIAEHRSAGVRLLNVADGGDEPFCPKEVRAANGRKNAAARDKRKWALLKQLGSGLRQGLVGEETKDLMRSRPDVFGQFAAYL